MLCTLLFQIALAAAPMHETQTVEEAVQTWLEANPQPWEHQIIAELAMGGPADPDGFGPHGVAVQLRPHIQGIEVDALTVLRIDKNGRLLRVSADPLPPPRRGGVVIAADRAIEAALGYVAGADPKARLSWQPSGPSLIRVWTIELRHALDFNVARVRVDAVSGLVLTVEEGSQADTTANVYVHNPVVDAGPVEVVLTDADVSLEDDRVEVFACRDQGETVESWTENGYIDIRICTEEPAPGPVAGAYDYQPVLAPADPARDEDDFGGPHTYWNVHQGLEWFDALGWTPVPEFDPRLTVVYNHRTADMWTEETASDPSAALKPYRNAYYTGGYMTWEDEWIPPRLVFGQADPEDFSYDADVIHHEMGHFINHSLNGPRYSWATDYGPSVVANALNEGLSDYYSNAIHGDGQTAEYAGGDEAIRDLDAEYHCDTDLYGESHYDGLPFSGALWQLRVTLPEPDQALLDRAVLDGVATMGTSPTFSSAADAIEAEVELGLGPAVAEDLRNRWDARGVYDCHPIMMVEPGDEPFRRFTTVGGSYPYNTLGRVPGNMQFSIEIPPEGAQVQLSFGQSEYLGFDLYESGGPQVLEVMGRSGPRITWEAQEVELWINVNFLMIANHWIHDAESVATAERVSTVPSDTNPQYDIHHYQAAWNVEEPGTYVFQLANNMPRSASATDLTVTLGPPVPDAGEDTGLELEPRDRKPEAKACGCATGSTGPWWMLLPLLAWRRSRSSRGVE